MVSTALLFGTERLAGSVGTFASTYSHTPGGLLALHRLLVRRPEFEPVRWERSWTDLGGEEQLLVVAGPLRSGPSQNETDALLRWVRAGNHLVYLRGGSEMIDLRADRSGALEEALGLPAEGEPGAIEGLLPEPDLVPGSDLLIPATPSALTAGIRRVETRAEGALKWPGGGLPLLETPIGGPHLVRRTMGRGTVTVGVSSSILSNELLGHEDNLLLAVNLAASAGGTILFDEYHHGYRQRPSLTTPAVRRVLWALAGQLAVLAVMFIAGRGRRFGRVRDPLRIRRRTSLEFVDALAELYRRGGAGGHVAARLLATFREQMAAALRVPHDAPTERLAEAIAACTDLGRSAVMRRLADAERAAGKSKLSRRRLLAVARGLAELRKEVL